MNCAQQQQQLGATCCYWCQTLSAASHLPDIASILLDRLLRLDVPLQLCKCLGRQSLSQKLPADSLQDTSYDCLADPVLQAVHRAYPAHVVGGYAAVDDTTLAWPGAPLFLLGRPAQLALGPSARALCPAYLAVV